MFVGSACTLELVDKNGKLIRRLPQFWGPPSLFRLIPGPSGAVRLLSARSITERANLTILDNMHPDPHRRAFNRAPEHFSQVSGWMDQRHQRILYQDVDNDGEKDVISDVAGVWNRVAVWDTAGNAKYAIYFGAGPSPYGNAGKLVPTLIRGMDAGDIDGDGQPELVAALSTGLIVVMNGRCEIKWSVRTDHPPTALKIHNGNILIGDEDGSVYMLQAQKFVLKGNVRHPVSDIIPRPGTGIVVVAANQLHFVSGPKL